MRKLGAANTKLFLIFAGLVVLVISVFAYGIIKVLSFDKNIYNLEPKSYALSSDYKPIMLNEAGTISQNWDGNYYLRIKNEKYNLGPQTVVYNGNDYRMYTYGTVYQIFEDGSVAKKIGQTEIVRNTKASFFKLADRKYLMVDKEIINGNKDLYAKNYLVIIIDKQGNGQLINNEVNLKTINSTVLKSSNFTFDIANEELKFNGKEIALKKVIGSTNQYVKSEDKGNDNTQNGGNVDTGDDDTPISETPEKIDFQKRVSLRGITPSITYLDVDYSVFDPANGYDTVFLVLSDLSGTRKIQLSKDETTHRVRELIPNYEYTVSIGYSYIDKEKNDSLVEAIQDVIKVRTAKPNYKLEITKISDSKIYFKLKLDSLYKLESGNIVLYSDKEKINSIAINPEAAITSNGWDGSLDLINPGYEISLVLEDAIYNGNTIKTDTQAKYINY